MLGSDDGSDPTEEDRTHPWKGRMSEGSSTLLGENSRYGGAQVKGSKEKKLFSCISEATSKEALEEILSPPVIYSNIEQTIRTGLLERPETGPAHVVLLAEFIPSWLAAADSWGSKQISLYCEMVSEWYRTHLDVVTPLKVFPTVAGLAKGSWIKESNKIVLVQGSARFCSKMVLGLESLGLTTEDKIIITCNGTPRKLKLSFNFLRLSHADLGGSTETKTSVGFSKLSSFVSR